MEHLERKKGLKVPSTEKEKDLFKASTNIHIGDGQTALFWHDNWLKDTSLKDRAPNLYKLTRRKTRTVAQEMENKNWIRAVRNISTTEQLREYVDLWILLRHVTLVQGTKDVVQWKWTANGEYNSCTAYRAQFIGMYRPFDTRIL